MNFQLRVLQYKKHQYQEGNENDCKLVCKDGDVFGGCTVLSFASRFMEMAIIKEREKQTGEELRGPVELDFKLYATKTIKTWLDLVYGVNVDPIPPKVGLQIIQFLSQLGHYVLPDGNDVYECTTEMINDIAENIEDTIGEMSKFEKVDLAMAAMVIPVPPSVMLTNLLMADISEDDVVRVSYELIVKTDYFEIYIENDDEEIKRTNFAIEIIYDYLKGIAFTLGDEVRTDGVTKKEFRNKFSQIQTHLREASNCCPCGESCELDFEDINYNIKVDVLESHKFVEYFRAKSNCTRSINKYIQPPKDAKEIFMGGGIIESNVVKLGVFGSTDELFDQREYPHHQDTEAKSVRKYFAYYDSGAFQPIGFSKTPTIRLGSVDRSSLDDESKLSACTTDGGCTLWRCGALNMENKTDFNHQFQLVFYCRT